MPSPAAVTPESFSGRCEPTGWDEAGERTDSTWACLTLILSQDVTEAEQAEEQAKREEQVIK